MKLYLVRHGEAKSEWEDSLRPLTDNGRTNVKRIAKRAKEKNISFLHLYHSGKTRAEQTARIFADVFQFEGEFKMIANLKPDDAVLPWIERLSHCQEDMMLVGHLPFLDALVSLLVTGNVNMRLVGFNPASLACLEKNDETEQWELLFVLHSETIL